MLPCSLNQVGFVPRTSHWTPSRASLEHTEDGESRTRRSIACREAESLTHRLTIRAEPLGNNEEREVRSAATENRRLLYGAIYS
jgi:hypothetical protein